MDMDACDGHYVDTSHLCMKHTSCGVADHTLEADAANVDGEMMGPCTSGAESASRARPLERGMDFDDDLDAFVHDTCPANNILDS